MRVKNITIVIAMTIVSCLFFTGNKLTAAVIQQYGFEQVKDRHDFIKKGKDTVIEENSIVTHNGKKSLEIRRGFVTVKLPENSSGILTVWVYDGTSMYQRAPSKMPNVSIVKDKDNWVGVEIIDEMESPFYTIVNSINGRRTTIDTIIRKKEGWHCVQFAKTAGDKILTIYLDGYKVGHSALKFKTIQQLQIGDDPTWRSRKLKARIFFDDISFDSDPAQIYRTPHKVGIILKTAKPINLFKPGESLKITAMLTDFAGKNRNLTVETSLFDVSTEQAVLNGKQLYLTKKNITIKANSTLKVAIKLPAQAPGLYMLLTKLKVSGKIIASSQLGVGVTPKLDITNMSPKNYPIGYDTCGWVTEHLNDIYPRLGAKYFLLRQHLIYMTPEQDKIDFSRIDKHIKLLEKYKPEFVFQINTTPKWLSSQPNKPHYEFYPPKDLKLWKQLITKIATHFKGKINYYELWNEPDTEQWEGTPAEYVAMAKATREALTAVDPKIKLVGICACQSIKFFWPGLFKAGIYKYLDAITHHIYLFDGPEETLLEKRLQGMNAYMVKHGKKLPLWSSEHACQIRGRIGNAGRPLMAAEVNSYTRMGHPVVITENNIVGPNTCLDEYRAADRLVRHYVICMANGVEKFFWWTGITLFGYGFQPTVPTLAHTVLADTINGATFVKKMDFKNNNIWGYIFTKKSGKFVILWSPAGTQSITLRAEPENAVIRLKTVTGKERKIATYKGIVSIDIGSSPIYLSGFKNISTMTNPASLSLEKYAVTGKQTEAIVAINNIFEQQFKGKIILKAPAGWNVSPMTKSFSLAKGASSKIKFNITPLGKVKAGLNKIVAMVKTGKQSFQVIAQLKVVKQAICKFTHKPVKVDGDLTGWGHDGWSTINDLDQVKMGIPSKVAAFIQDYKVWQGVDDLSAKFKTQWDGKNLYVAIKVTDDSLKNVNKVMWPWEGDCIELFLDLRTLNKQGMATYDKNVRQILVVPTLKQGGKARFYKHVATGALAASKITKTGYTIELKLPIQAMSEHSLKRGDIIGFDLAIDDDNGKKNRKTQMIWAGSTLNSRNASQFGKLRLE
jgi:hypothetical protein